MFGVFLCVQVHAHTHVFVLNKYVYVFVNGIKTFEKNIMNPAVKNKKLNSGTFLCLVRSSEGDLRLGPSELPLLLSNTLGFCYTSHL